MCDIPGAGDELVHAPGPPGGRAAQHGGQALSNRPLTDEERGQIEARIVALEIEHHDLDDVIDRLVLDPIQDQLQLRRLKKRKLFLRDTISRLKDRLIPDIIA
jgi:hypothetical protein